MFNNNCKTTHIYSLSILANNDHLKNKEKRESTRKIICFFLIDPGNERKGQSSKDKMVNMGDKYLIILENWLRKSLGKRAPSYLFEFLVETFLLDRVEERRIRDIKRKKKREPKRGKRGKRKYGRKS